MSIAANSEPVPQKFALNRRHDADQIIAVMFRPIITKVGSKSLQPFFRSSFRPSSKTLTSSLLFAPAAKRFATHNATTHYAPPAAASTNWPKILGQLGIIGGTVVGLNLFFNRETREGGIPPLEQAYLHETFKYVGAGLGICALAARGLHTMGWSRRLMTMNPWVVLGGGLALSIGTNSISLTFINLESGC